MHFYLVKQGSVKPTFMIPILLGPDPIVTSEKINIFPYNDRKILIHGTPLAGFPSVGEAVISFCRSL
jgi:hypothetical protein